MAGMHVAVQRSVVTTPRSSMCIGCPPVEASPRTKRINVGNVVSETFSIYGQNVGALLGSAIVVFVVVGVVSGLLSNAGGVLLSLLALIVRMAGTALYTGFVVKLVEDTRDGRRDVGIGELFSSAAPAIGSLIIMAILFGFAVGIGFFLLIIPGLFLLTIWAVTAPAIVAERVGPIESFGRSFQLVRGDGWSVFGTLVVIWVITIVIAAILTLIGAAIGAGALVVAVVVASVVTAPLHSLAVSVMFFDLGGGRSAPAAGVPPTPPPAAPTT
jgi:hypothetical protein